MKRLVLFDFDGTITRKDTLLLMAKYSHHPISCLTKLVRFVPWFLLTKTGLISAKTGKEKFLKFFYKGMKIDQFDNYCRSFCKEYLPEFIHPKALDEIQKYKNDSASVFIVSASPENWIIPWASLLDVDVIATKLESIDDKITGKIIGENCNGSEKVIRIKKAIELSEFNEIVAFGDSKGDLEMLELADKKYYKLFN